MKEALKKWLVNLCLRGLKDHAMANFVEHDWKITDVDLRMLPTGAMRLEVKAHAMRSRPMPTECFVCEGVGYFDPERKITVIEEDQTIYVGPNVTVKAR